LTKGENIKGNVLVHESAKIDPTALIGPNVVIGKDVVVGPGTRIYTSTIMAGTKIEGYSVI
jgi:mannose-1-phosphate guanylyltransferase